MNLQDEHIGLCIYLFMMKTDEQWQRSHDKQQHMLVLGKKKI